MKTRSLLRLLALGVALLTTMVSVRAQQTILIDTSSSWRNVVDDRSDQGTAWRAPGFDDSAWSSGVPLFGSDTTPAVSSHFSKIITNGVKSAGLCASALDSDPCLFPPFVLPEKISENNPHHPNRFLFVPGGMNSFEDSVCWRILGIICHFSRFSTKQGINRNLDFLSATMSASYFFSHNLPCPAFSLWHA